MTTSIIFKTIRPTLDIEWPQVIFSKDIVNSLYKIFEISNFTSYHAHPKKDMHELDKFFSLRDNLSRMEIYTFNEFTGNEEILNSFPYWQVNEEANMYAEMNEITYNVIKEENLNLDDYFLQSFILAPDTDALIKTFSTY